MSTSRQLAILGSTGSVGVNTLDVVARHPDRYEVFALSAHSRVEPFAAQCLALRPRYAVMCGAEPARALPMTAYSGWKSRHCRYRRSTCR